MRVECMDGACFVRKFCMKVPARPVCLSRNGQYPDLRAFFTKFEGHDHEPTVLKAAVTTAAK